MMEPINNNGVVNYPVTMPEQEAIQNDYATMPVEYDEPEIAEQKKASSNMIGMTALGVLGAAGVIYGAVKHKSCKSAKNALADMTAERDKLAQELDTANKKIEELTPKSFKERIKNWFKKHNPFSKKNDKQAAEEAKKEVEDAATKKD